MIRIDDRSTCCGCGACAAVCPVKAITMRPDGMGFLYPEVDHTACIQCGKCLETCAFSRDQKISSEGDNPEAYAARARDIAVMGKSSSGGFGFLLMKAFIEAGGVVYGARYGADFRVEHARAVTKDGIEEFRTAKYAQSNPGETFDEVLKDLERRSVLFTGTPCQTAALAGFVGESLRPRLLLADVLCHGVGSPEVWAAFIRNMEERKGAHACKVSFRDPSFGWDKTVSTVSFRDGSRKSSCDWARLYKKNVMLRPSCSRCPYASPIRPSDLSMGDCWGIERVRPEYAEDNLGCSLVLVHTLAGRHWLDRVRPELEVSRVALEDVLQPSLLSPVPREDLAESFERDFLTLDYPSIRRKYVVPSLKERWRATKWKVKTLMKRIGLWK